MSGEYINAKIIEEYWDQLRLIYKNQSISWKDLTEEEYKKIERSEREDSDNHYNQERLGKETEVVDLAYYKYLPERKAAYHIHIIHKNGDSKDYYFQIELR